MLDIDLDTQGLLDALAEVGHNVSPGSAALEGALDVAAERVLSAKQREVQKTYSRPIPTGKNGKPKWTRKGNFEGDQTILQAPGERYVGGLGKSTEPITNYPGGYEERLAVLDSERRNPASENAYDKVVDQVPAIFEQELLNNLGY